MGDQTADVPVKPDKLGVRGKDGRRLCLLDAGFDLLAIMVPSFLAEVGGELTARPKV